MINTLLFVYVRVLFGLRQPLWCSKSHQRVGNAPLQCNHTNVGPSQAQGPGSATVPATPRGRQQAQASNKQAKRGAPPLRCVRLMRQYAKDDPRLTTDGSPRRSGVMARLLTGRCGAGLHHYTQSDANECCIWPTRMLGLVVSSGVSHLKLLWRSCHVAEATRRPDIGSRQSGATSAVSAISFPGNQSSKKVLVRMPTLYTPAANHQTPSTINQRRPTAQLDRTVADTHEIIRHNSTPLGHCHQRKPQLYASIVLLTYSTTHQRTTRTAQTRSFPFCETLCLK